MAGSETLEPPARFREYYPYVTLHIFNYTCEIVGTPLQQSRHFDSWDKLLGASIDVGVLSDIVRNLLLHNYGGIWLDNDAVPLRDLWNITAVLGLQMVPKFHGSFTNGHFLYIRCPRSALARRRLEHLVLFPCKYQDAWPRTPLTGNMLRVYNDALPEHILAVQAARYNISKEIDGDLTSISLLPVIVYDDLQVPMTVVWFDPWWVCNDCPHFSN